MILSVCLLAVAKLLEDEKTLRGERTRNRLREDEEDKKGLGLWRYTLWNRILRKKDNKNYLSSTPGFGFQDISDSNFNHELTHTCVCKYECAHVCKHVRIDRSSDLSIFLAPHETFLFRMY